MLAAPGPGALEQRQDGWAEVHEELRVVFAGGCLEHGHQPRERRCFIALLMQRGGAQHRELAQLPVAVGGARGGFEVVEDRERVVGAVLRERALHEHEPGGVVFAPDRRAWLSTRPPASRALRFRPCRRGAP